jgi:prolyl-tRNA editing enzyme YbaK/EbsC (Cys-tRNA(Pro) deacylase)
VADSAFDEERDWPRNYFNYFTEIEEHFQRARGSGLFLLSPLDWALIESWKNSGLPLEAVLRGIDAAFLKWRSRKTRTQAVNSLAYCAQAVMQEAEILANAGKAGAVAVPLEAPYTAEELASYLRGNASPLKQKESAVFGEIAASLETLAASAGEYVLNLEELEQRLTVLEEKLVAAVRVTASEETMFQARREMEAQIRPYRGKMTADQLAQLERQYLDRRLLEDAGVRRLSLFYL